MSKDYYIINYYLHLNERELMSWEDYVIAVADLGSCNCIHQYQTGQEYSDDIISVWISGLSMSRKYNLGKLYGAAKCIVRNMINVPPGHCYSNDNDNDSDNEETITSLAKQWPKSFVIMEDRINRE
jgi:hypothetical protein